MNKEASNLLAKLVTEIYKNEQLQQKLNQLEANINKAIKIIDNYNCRKGWYENDTDKVIDNIKNTLLERGEE